MAPSWISGALRNLFGANACTAHWAIAKSSMEQTFGAIKINVPLEGGKTTAFFEKQTLLGDEARLKTVRYTHPITTVDMKEALGTGETHEEAIVDLWNKMTGLRPYESILQLKQHVSHGEPHALYTRFNFRNGYFANLGQTSNECPPDRADSIITFLAEEKQHRTMSATERLVIFGRSPSGSET